MGGTVDSDQTLSLFRPVCPNTQGKYASLIKSKPLINFEPPIKEFWIRYWWGGGWIYFQGKAVLSKLGQRMTKQQNGRCAQRRLRSAWASAQSSLCAHCLAKDPSFLYADSED